MDYVDYFVIGLALGYVIVYVALWINYSKAENDQTESIPTDKWPWTLVQRQQRRLRHRYQNRSKIRRNARLL